MTTSIYQTVVNTVTGTLNSGGYNSQKFTYNAAVGNVIVGFDYNSGCVVDAIIGVYTVPASNLTATPTRSVLNPAFMASSPNGPDTVVYVTNSTTTNGGFTFANGEANVAGGSPATMLAPSGSFINSMTVQLTNGSPVDVGYLAFGYINPVTMATGTMTMNSSVNGCGWWGAGNPAPYVYVGTSLTSALTGFSCFSNEWLGGISQVTFYDYVTQAAVSLANTTATQNPSAGNASTGTSTSGSTTTNTTVGNTATTIATSDPGGTAVVTVPNSSVTVATTSYTMYYIIAIVFIALATGGFLYYRSTKKQSQVYNPIVQPLVTTSA